MRRDIKNTVKGALGALADEVLDADLTAEQSGVLLARNVLVQLRLLADRHGMTVPRHIVRSTLLAQIEQSEATAAESRRMLAELDREVADEYEPKRSR
jgi:hypothetical protein